METKKKLNGGKQNEQKQSKELWEEGDEIIAIAHKLTTSDLGEFGKQFVKSGLVADGAEVALTVEFMKKA
jgi:hypothetical protein